MDVETILIVSVFMLIPSSLSLTGFETWTVQPLEWMVGNTVTQKQ